MEQYRLIKNLILSTNYYNFQISYFFTPPEQFFWGSEGFFRVLYENFRSASKSFHRVKNANKIRFEIKLNTRSTTLIELLLRILTLAMPNNLDQHIRPPNSTFTDNVLHPSQRRGNPYSQDKERKVLVTNFQRIFPKKWLV